MTYSDTYTMQKLIALILFVITSPLLFIFFILVRTTSRGPFIFSQPRLGQYKKPFRIYKIRTMVLGAENMKHELMSLNERTGPVFKIRNDPRYTTVGKFLSHAGLDELPQLINIIKGEMAFVGPRPFPINEATQVPEKYKKGSYITWHLTPGT